MKTRIAALLTLPLAALAAHASPAGDAAAAAAKLAAASNYSFTRTSEIANSQFPATPVEGQAEKGGFMVTTMSFNGNTFQTVAKGGESVSQGQDGTWLTAEERRAQFASRGGGNRGGGNRSGNNNGGGNSRGRSGRGGFGYFGFGGGTRTSPAEDAASLASKLKDAKLEDGAIAGTLSADDAAELLTFGGRGGQGPKPKNVSGTARFWVKNGALSKYALTLRATMATPNGDEREFERTTTTEFKDVGSTKVNVPDEAKKKLGS